MRTPADPFHKLPPQGSSPLRRRGRKKLLPWLLEWADDFISLFYPNLCAACRRALVKGESDICLMCQFELPETGFHTDPNNHVVIIFRGRVQLEHATALYFFGHKSKVQQLMHQLKYKDRPQIGLAIGRYYGRKLKNTPPYNTVDCIMPVPLHPRKEHRRGYNQSALFARGLSESMGVPAYSRGLIRLTDTDTQTRKTRIARWDNVDKVFAVSRPRALEGKHVLLVDDVITTGATLEACAQRLLAIPGVQVSVATIATAFRF